MRKILFLFVSLLVVSVTVSAQQGQRGQRMTPEESAKQYTELMTSEFKLTAQQVTSVTSVNLEIAKEQSKLMENANGDFSSLRESRQKLEEKRAASLEKILTKDQMDSYKKWAAERQQRGPGGQGGGQGGGQRQRNN